MKKLMVIVAGCLLTMGLSAQDNGSSGTTGDQDKGYKQDNGKRTEKTTQNKKDQDQSGVYCVMHKDGKKKLVTGDDKDVNNEVTLQNGTRVKSDGTVIKEDGSRVTLDAGECIDSKGMIKSSTGKDKNMKPYDKNRKDKTFDKDRKGTYDKNKREPGDMDDENNK
jgi:hypothetical protein